MNTLEEVGFVGEVPALAHRIRIEESVKKLSADLVNLAQVQQVLIEDMKNLATVVEALVQDALGK